MLVTGTVRFVELFAQPLHLDLGLESQRVIGLHAQDQVHAALEVEPELELLVHQHGGRMNATPRGEQGIDANGGKRHEDDDDGDEFPAKVRHVVSGSPAWHDCVLLPLAVASARRLLHRFLALVAADGGPGHFDSHLVRDLNLNPLFAEARHLSVDAARS